MDTISDAISPEDEPKNKEASDSPEKKQWTVEINKEFESLFDNGT